MTNLLYKPFKAFTLYSFLILLISIPVYVLVVDYIWVNELDENNWLMLEHTKKKLKANKFTNEEIIRINELWGELQPGVSIKKVEEEFSKKDSVYEIIRPNEYDLDDNEDRFRGLISFIHLNDQYYELTIETNVEELDETLYAISLVTIFFFILLFLGFVFLNRKISKNSWLPFFNTLEELKNFDLAKNKPIIYAPTDIFEFNELNNSLKKLIDKNIQTYQNQKLFIENASHELQTPLALLKAKFDLLIQEQGISPQVAQHINSIEIPLSRLTRINKNMLLLAKVENQQFEKIEEIDLSNYIESALILFEDFIKTKHITIKNNIQEPFVIKAHPFLIEILLQNLLSNAIRHSKEGDEIILDSKNNIISFANTGLARLDSNTLFERFSSVTKDKISSGLGLSIIKQIANKYNFKVEYQFKKEFHIFSVVF